MLKNRKLADVQGAKAPHRHELLLFSEDEVLVKVFTRFIAAALNADNAAIALVRSHTRRVFVKD
jgi:hypothetical protein